MLALMRVIGGWKKREKKKLKNDSAFSLDDGREKKKARRSCSGGEILAVRGRVYQ